MEEKILVHFIKIDLKQSKTHDIKKVLILHAIDRAFLLGENYLERSSTEFIITKVENCDNIYDFLPHNNKIRITNRKTGVTNDVENNLIFDSETIPKVVFSENNVTKRVLYGLDQRADDVYSLLKDNRTNKLICLHGPRGSGKRLLLKNMEIEMENKQFFWLNDWDIKANENHLLKLMDEILPRSCDVVLCYLPSSENLIDKDFKQGLLFDVFDSLLGDQFIRINIVISCENMNLLLPRILEKAMYLSVRNLNLKEKSEFIKYLIKTKTTGRDTSFEDGFEMISSALNGFTASDIEWFINKVQIVDPNLSLTEMVKCSKKIEFTPNHLVKFKIDFIPLHWSDIGGYESAKQLLREEVEIPLKMGKEPVRGVLLHGPSGCSKTMLATALATECQIGFFLISPSTVMRSIVGESERMLSQIFEQAVAMAPSIIFIDEIDTILPNRSGDEISVQYRLLNQLMTFTDGIHSKKENKVIIMAATNKFELLDKAFIRPGRMDLIIKIDLPDQSSRESILIIAFSNQLFKVDSEVIESIPLIAELLENKSGAEIVEFANSVKDLSKLPTEIDSDEYIYDPIVTMDHICKILSKKFQIDYRFS